MVFGFHLMDHHAELNPLHFKHDSLRSPWHPPSIAAGTVVPTVLFAKVYYCCVFLRDPQPVLACVIPFALVVATVIVSLITRIKSQRRFPVRGHIATVICMWVGLVLGAVGGNWDYYFYMSRYLAYTDMASYTNIDPGLDMGQSYMDAGAIYFKEGSRVLTERSIAFQLEYVFCVAPIARDDMVLDPDTVHNAAGTVDFWAVGVDCCESDGSHFRCGDVKVEDGTEDGYEAGLEVNRNLQARAGMRMLDDTLRPFYALAVQQWTASTMLPAKHPLFFHWVMDPMLQVDLIYQNVRTQFQVHVVSFAFFSLGLMLTLLYIFFEGVWGYFRLS